MREGDGEENKAERRDWQESWKESRSGGLVLMRMDGCSLGQAVCNGTFSVSVPSVTDKFTDYTPFATPLPCLSEEGL